MRDPSVAGSARTAAARHFSSDWDTTTRSPSLSSCNQVAGACYSPASEALSNYCITRIILQQCSYRVCKANLESLCTPDCSRSRTRLSCGSQILSIRLLTVDNTPRT
jgi:hypothetical protein